MTFEKVVFISCKFTFRLLAIPLNIQELVDKLETVTLEFLTHRVRCSGNHLAFIIRSNKWNKFHFFQLNFPKFDQISCGFVLLYGILFIKEHIIEVCIPEPIIEQTQQNRPNSSWKSSKSTFSIKSNSLVRFKCKIIFCFDVV